MKTKKILLLIPFLLIMSLMGCRKDSEVSDCDEPALEVSFQGFGTRVSGNDCSLQNIDDTQTEVVLVIDKIADFRKYVSYINGLEVDFSKHFVLAGALNVQLVHIWRTKPCL